MNKEKTLIFIKNLILNFLGNFIYGFGVMAFIEQNNLITGGVTGISLFFHYLTKLPTSIFAAILNVIFFTVGYFTLGKRFSLSTLASTIFFPICVAILELFDLSIFIQTEMWLNIVAGGLLIGFGIGLVMRTGGSTGGLDIPAILLNKYFGFISIGVSIALFDIIILFSQMFGGATIEYVLYGIILLFIYSFAIDKVVLFGKNKIELKIVSKKQEEIRKSIITDLDRGVTLLHSTTGYLGNNIDTILTVIDVRELNRIERFIHDIDPEAFIIISQVKEVKGRGFSEDKVYEVNEENNKTG